MSCETCKEKHQQSDSFNNDLAMAHMAKIIKLLIICVLICVFLLAVSNAAWLYAWNQYDYAGTEEIVASVPCICGCSSVSVRNISTQPVNVQNANIVFDFTGIRR